MSSRPALRAALVVAALLVLAAVARFAGGGFMDALRRMHGHR
jgi:hypothetical protein